MEKIGNYCLSRTKENELGRGSFSIVYSATYNGSDNVYIKNGTSVVRRDSLFRIDGFGSSYTSALLHFHFPTLIPILDRRVLNGAGINAEINAQGQVVDIERYYPELIQYFHRELRNRPEIDLRALDKELFIKPIAK